MKFLEKEKKEFDARVIAVFMASIADMIWGFRIYYMNTEFPWMSILSTFLILLSVSGMAICILQRKRDHWISYIEWALLIGALSGLFVWTYTQILNSPAYGTDELAFDQYAWHLTLHHINPYISSMRPAFTRYHVSPIGYTFTYSGKAVTSLSYPALSFLLYAPLWFLGIHAQNAVWTDILFWAISMIMVFLLSKKTYRAFAIVLFSWSFYVGFMEGGITDSLFIPFLLLSAYRWDHYAKEYPRRWWAPLCFGLAMSVKQTPWFIAPFLLISIWHEARALNHPRRKTITISLTYIGFAFIGFIVPNLYFIAINPIAWIRGILTPLFSNIVPSGQGVIALSVFEHFGGGNVSFLSDSSILILLALCITYALFYNYLKPWLFFIPSLIFMFTTRSFASYFADLLPVVLLSLMTYHPTEQQLSKRNFRFRRNLTLFSFLPGAVFLVLAFRFTGPLHITIQDIHTTGQYGTIDEITVRVKNTSLKPVLPSFSVDTGGQYTTFWNIIDHESPISPYHTEKFTLEAPNVESMPPVTGGFQVVGFTESPYSISASKSYVPSLWHVILTPESVSRPVHVGQSILLIAKVVNRENQPILQKNIPVYLGQVIYAQSGLEFSQVKINHGAIGQTPVEALTNKKGQASFRIYPTIASKDPVYFEANLVNSKFYYPYGYSNTVSVLFH